MFFKLSSYLNYIIKSTNEHDVHSPFVFNYLTQCLYQRPHKTKDRALNILLKSIPYFKIKKVRVVGNDNYLAQLSKLNPAVTEQIPLDLIYLEHLDITSAKLWSANEIHNNSLILVNNIRVTSDFFAQWQKLIQEDTITVSIDFFSCGLLFFRKEQEKQHFTIRI